MEVAMNMITSNRVFDSYLQDPVRHFCSKVGIRSAALVEVEGGIRIRTERRDYAMIIRLIELEEEANEGYQREYARHSAEIRRLDECREIRKLEASCRRTSGRKAPAGRKRAA
jgi:hypothetical protein